MEEQASFHIWQQFLAHEDDVKAVVPTSERHLVTCSRDDTCKLWVENENGYKQLNVFNNKQQVNSLEFYEAVSGQEYIIAGRKDGSIAFFSSVQEEPVVVVPMHKLNVCTMKLDPHRRELISASWDTTAAVLDLEKAIKKLDPQLHHLQGHTYSVWAVGFIPNQPDHYITGAADRLVKIWHGSQVIRTIEDHTDVIRSIMFLNDNTFLTAANDSAIRIFNLGSYRAIEKYESTHGEFYYSLTKVILPNNLKYVVASSEKGYVDFYQLVADDTVLIPTQSIRVPAMSLWSICSTSDSEVCVAASTGFVYIFTANPEKPATEALTHALDVELDAFITREAQAAQQAQNGDSGDPYTSGGGYVPPPPVNPLEFYGPGDPYTSGGRYIPGQGSGLVPNASQTIDPRRPKSEYVPIPNLFLFNDKPGEKVVEALKVANEMVGPEYQLEEPLFEALVEMLKPEFEYNEIQSLALEKALGWPIDQVFCILDVFRYAVLNPIHNQHFFSQPRTLTVLLQLLISDPSFKVKTFTCRALANSLLHESAKKLLFGHLSEVLEVVCSQISSEKPVLQLASITCLANLAYVALTQTEAGMAELGPREDILRSIIKSITQIQYFSYLTQPSLLRLLQTIVTSMWGDSTVIKLGQQNGISNIVQRIKDAVASDEGKNVARDIYVMTM